MVHSYHLMYIILAYHYIMRINNYRVVMLCVRLQILQSRAYSTTKAATAERIKKWMAPDMKSVSKTILDRWMKRDGLDPAKFTMIYAYPHHRYTWLGPIAILGLGGAVGLCWLHDQFFQPKLIKPDVINEAAKESPGLLLLLGGMMLSYVAIADLFRRRTLIRLYRSIGDGDNVRFMAVWRTFFLRDIRREFSLKEVSRQPSNLGWYGAKFAGKPAQFWSDYFEEPRFYHELTDLSLDASKNADTMEDIMNKLEKKMQPPSRQKRKPTDWVDRIK